MNDLISKLSSYNLFNYLLPGVLFSFLVENFTKYSLIQENLFVGAFLYYFVGLIISRIGSLAIEPFLKWVKFLKFADYKDFIKASKHDEKIEIFSEQNNMYRTFVSMFFLFFVLKIYESLSFVFPILKEADQFVLLFLILCLFLGSYRKQTNYITKRISLHSKQDA